MSGPRILLTGASGFVGRHLLADLAAAGYGVRVATRRRMVVPPGVEQVVVGDLAESVDWTTALAGVDAVVHGAGIAHAGPGIPEERYRRVNTDATVALARAAQGRVGRFVFISSIRAQSGPVAPTVLTEADPPQPTDPYGRSKLAAEQALAALDLPWVALRPVLVYGEGVAGNMGALIRLARSPLPLPFGALRGERSLVAVETLAAAIRHVIALPEAPRRAMIVADPAPVTIPVIITALRAGFARPPGLLSVPRPVLAGLFRLAGRSASFTRLGSALAADAAALRRCGFAPPWPTEEGLRRLAARLSGQRILE
ncbi:NAD-dependent epimerase/dehydratase family protein [Chelatococcus sp. GCM10030263]|uniref:NAD-dependent epimerase/dehydratase family protein n=1 Tax=Chelatococcus sp. GCM10030263 TaxID=3273387 RepID=UPI0036094559